MIAEEFKAVFPQSKLTPQSITDIYYSILDIRQDITKFRLVGYSYITIKDEPIATERNQVYVLINAVGIGTLQFDGNGIYQTPKGELTDWVFTECIETGAGKCSLQVAIFTWD